MVSRRVLRFAILIAVLALASIAHADYVGPFTETWSDDGDVEGWAGYGVTHDDVYDRLNWSGVHWQTGQGYIYAYEGNNPSDMRYLGDLTGAGAISFDLCINEGSSVGRLWVALNAYNDYTNTPQIWTYDLAPVIGETSYTIAFDSSNWLRTQGSDTMEQALTNVTEWQILWTRDGSTGTVSGYLDNFGIGDAPVATPEPGTMALVILGLSSLGYIRRRQSAEK